MFEVFLRYVHPSRWHRVGIVTYRFSIFSWGCKQSNLSSFVIRPQIYNFLFISPKSDLCFCAFLCLWVPCKAASIHFSLENPLLWEPVRLFHHVTKRSHATNFVAWLLYSNQSPARSWFQRLMEQKDRICKSLKSIIIWWFSFRWSHTLQQADVSRLRVRACLAKCRCFVRRLLQILRVPKLQV